MLTPFEKNLEVWRQLWRVLERSDIVVQASTLHTPLHPTFLPSTPYVLAMPSKFSVLHALRVAISQHEHCQFNPCMAQLHSFWCAEQHPHSF